MTELSLHRILTRLLYTSLASSALAGCGPDVTLYDTPMCTANGSLSVEGLQPGIPIDYVEMRRTDPSGSSATAIAQAGVKCETATDRTACSNNLNSLNSTNGFHISCLPGACIHYLATTAGDAVSAVTSAAQLRSLLGAIDSPQEALLMAFAQDYDISCSDKEQGAVRAVADGNGYEVLGTKLTRDCDPVEVTGYRLHVSRDGNIAVLSERVISSQKGVCVGRRPAGLASAAPCDADAAGGRAAGEYLKNSAELEAAAVAAFQILGRELAAHGAPSELHSATARAAADEVRHAAITARLARRYGGRPEAPRIAPRGVRALCEIAVENAVEGCVRETYGALVALRQARLARDPAVRQAMAGIAADEVRHAALSWSVAAWANHVLPKPARARIAAAKEQAVQTLRAEVAQAPAAGLQALLGLPSPEQAQALVDSLNAALWHAA